MQVVLVIRDNVYIHVSKACTSQHVPNRSCSLVCVVQTSRFLLARTGITGSSPSTPGRFLIRVRVDGAKSLRRGWVVHVLKVPEWQMMWFQRLLLNLA
jgi:hypothetical protein